ncbi:MAG: cytochrome c [Thermodesulfovibrionales bacterium]
MKLMILLFLFVLSGIVIGSAEEIKTITLPDLKIELKEGEGLDKVKTHCNTCHSLDYITMQPRFSAQQWTGIVSKMRKVFGAPISDTDAELIVKYLSINYGK